MADDVSTIPRTAAQYAEVHKAMSSREVDTLHKPYSPLPPGTSLPTMGENWAYAMRRYGRFQGYAWAGVAGVGLLVYGGSLLGKAATPAPKEKEGGVPSKGS